MDKYLLRIVIFILLLNYQLLSQWSTDPNNTLIVGYGLDPHICSDSAGGCYITYDYENLYYPRKLALERLDRYGYKPWGTLKQIQGDLPEQFSSDITEDGQGGVIVSYLDRYENYPEWIQRIKVQRADSSGNLMWGEYGVRITLTNVNQEYKSLISDGDGGCVIVWQDIGNTYHTNRIDKNGNRLWGDNGITLNTGALNYQPKIVRASDGNYYAQGGLCIFRIKPNGEIVRSDSVSFGYMDMVPDTEGGIVLGGKVWPGVMIANLVVQRRDSLGNDLWQEPYVEIAESLYINTQIRTQNNGDYFYFGWSGTKNGFDRVAQFQVLRADGSKLFSQGSMQLSENSPIGSPLIVPSDLSKTIFIWNDPTISSSTIAQKYDTLGNKLWNENGVIISYPAIAYETTTDSKGGFINMGPINQFTIVVQQVNKFGQLGNVIIPVELISFYAKVAGSAVKLNWVTATETNNKGFDVEKQVSSLQSTVNKWKRIVFVNGNGTTTKPKSYSFIDNNVTEGKYKYRLKQIDYDGTIKYSKEIEVEVNYTPKEYLLYQNYPNPFNSTTIIKYQVPKEGRVKINIYNILGEKLRTLYEGERNKGLFTLVVSSDELSSGAYFYSLESNSSRTVKKLTILK